MLIRWLTTENYKAYFTEKSIEDEKINIVENDEAILESRIWVWWNISELIYHIAENLNIKLSNLSQLHTDPVLQILN